MNREEATALDKKLKDVMTTISEEIDKLEYNGTTDGSIIKKLQKAYNMIWEAKLITNDKKIKR